MKLLAIGLCSGTGGIGISAFIDTGSVHGLIGGIVSLAACVVVILTLKDGYSA